MSLDTGQSPEPEESTQRRKCYQISEFTGTMMRELADGGPGHAIPQVAYVSDVLAECPQRACAVQRRRFPVGASPTRQSLQPEAIGAVMEVTKWLKPSISVSRIGDSASVQAAT